MQASLARRACILLLERVATPANCFTLLHLATRCKLPSLAAAAQAVALADFAQACEQDREGLFGLPKEVLGRLLGSYDLSVSSELQVFQALADWVGADKAARLPQFHELLGEDHRGSS